MNPSPIPTVDVATLRNWLDIGKPLSVVDVRSLDQRQEWSIPDSIHADVYEQLKAGDIHALSNLELPVDKPVVTVCGAGIMSMRAAEQLQAQGYTVYSLEGGMQAWSAAWNTAYIPTNNPDLTILQIRRTGKGCLSYLVASQGEALVIDASLDERVYIGLAIMHGWQIRYVLDTHLHADHLSRSQQLANKTNSQLLLPVSQKFQFPYQAIDEHTTLTLGATRLQVIQTPGHTLESVCYLIDNEHLFTGDTLFIDSVGRPDLKASASELMLKASRLYHSIHKLLALPVVTQVMPGHTSRPVAFDQKPLLTTIGELSQSVPLLSLEETEFIDYLLDRIPPTPPNYLVISEINGSGDFASVDPAEVEAGANRCAIR
jgi:glyoxylase-like metal-dependent hydrolase (beta-lactamase superfamily II)